MSFYLAIILFISSVIIGLVLMTILKNVSWEKFRLAALAHSMLLFAFVASLCLQKGKSETGQFNYFFLIYFCSGVTLSGLVWRSRAPKWLRVYFSLFILGFPMFLFSPSMMVNFLLTTNYTDSLGPRFQVQGNLWLETQNTVMKTDSVPHYKLIRKRGLYRETLARDLVFGGKLDSIKVLDLQQGVSATLRGYTSTITYVSSDVDSMELEIPLVKYSRDNVEYRL